MSLKDIINELEKIKYWAINNAITVHYDEAQEEIMERHIVVDRHQENGRPSLIEYINKEIDKIKNKRSK